MPVRLQDAIDAARAPGSTVSWDAYAVISMHDSAGVVYYGLSRASFRPDLPLQNAPATIAPAMIARPQSWVSRWPAQAIPGFSSRGYFTEDDTNLFWASNRFSVTAVQWFLFTDAIPMWFSIRLDPGISPFLSRAGFGPSIQIEIETFADAARTNQLRGILLNAVEDGVLLRAEGDSLENPGQKA